MQPKPQKSRNKYGTPNPGWKPFKKKKKPKAKQGAQKKPPQRGPWRG